MTDRLSIFLSSVKKIADASSSENAIDNFCGKIPLTKKKDHTQAKNVRGNLTKRAMTTFGILLFGTFTPTIVFTIAAGMLLIGRTMFIVEQIFALVAIPISDADAEICRFALSILLVNILLILIF